MFAKCYAVIDTNVIVSAFLKRNSVPDTLLDLVFSGFIVPLLNDEIVCEYKQVLSRDKFGFDAEIVTDFIEQISEQALFIDEEKLDIEFGDIKDKVFYEIVMEKRKSDEAYLVTGNIKHFPAEPFVVTPREMLEIILSEE